MTDHFLSLLRATSDLECIKKFNENSGLKKH